MNYAYNYVAIIAAAISSFLIGFIWFTLIFKEVYTEGLGKTEQQLNAGTSMLIASLLRILGNIVLAIVLSWLLKKLGCETILEGVQIAALLWLGFTVAILGPTYAYQAYSFKFFLLNAGAILMYMLVTTIILTAWK